MGKLRSIENKVHKACEKVLFVCLPGLPSFDK